MAICCPVWKRPQTRAVYSPSKETKSVVAYVFVRFRYFQQILSLTNEKLGDLKNISFKFIGNITNKKVYELYRKNQIDPLINLSLSEGLPVTFMEAFSFAVPVLAINVGGIKEIIIKMAFWQKNMIHQ